MEIKHSVQGIISNQTIDKSETEIFENIDKLFANFAKEVAELTKSFDLREYAKIYPRTRDFNVDSDTMENNFKENIDFVNSALAHQIVILAKIEELKDQLLNNLAHQLYQLEMNSKVKVAENNHIKSTILAQQKGWFKRVKRFFTNSNIYPPQIIKDEKELEIKKNLIIKIKAHTENQYIDAKANNIFKEICKQHATISPKGIEIINFKKLEKTIKSMLKSDNVMKSLNQELQTYRIAKDYQSILDLCETDTQYKNCELVRLFDVRVGDQLNNQLCEIKKQLNNSLANLTKKSTNLEHVLANLSSLESNLISGFLVSVINYFPEKTKNMVKNCGELANPETRNKRLGIILASVTISAIIATYAWPSIVHQFNLSKTNQTIVENSVKLLSDDKPDISLEQASTAINYSKTLMHPEQITKINNSVTKLISENDIKKAVLAKKIKSQQSES